MTEDPGSPGFGGDELLTWSGLATVLEWLPPLLDAQLQRDADLTHFEFGVLYALEQAPDSTLRMSVLAGYANSTLTRLSRAVTRLEQRRLVERTRIEFQLAGAALDQAVALHGVMPLPP